LIRNTDATNYEQVVCFVSCDPYTVAKHLNALIADGIALGEGWHLDSRPVCFTPWNSINKTQGEIENRSVIGDEEKYFRLCRKLNPGQQFRTTE
jgi:hypothetical protein